MMRLIDKIKSSSPKTMALILGIWAMLLYSPVLFGDYIYDDHLQVETNQWLNAIDNLPEYFEHSTNFFQNPTSQGPANYYRPMHMVTYWATRQLLGHQPWSYHLINILLYGLVVSLFFLLARKWLAPLTATLAALLFACAPYHVEAVAWIAALPELLGAGFILLVVLNHMKAQSSWYGATLLFILFLMALLTREHALVIPGLLMVYDWLWKRWKNWTAFKQQLLNYAMMAMAIIIYFVLRINTLGHALTDTGLAYPLGVGAIIINWPGVVLDYLIRFIMPATYSGFYLFDPMMTIWNAKFWVALIIIGLLSWWGLKNRRKETMVMFYLAWIGICLLPFLYFPALGENIITERYLFLPSVGAMMILGWLLKSGLDLISTKWLRIVYQTMIIILILVWSLATLNNMRYWKNDLTWCQQTLKVEPRAYHFYNLIGNYYYNQGQLDDAFTAHAQLEQVGPNHLNRPIQLRQVAQLGNKERIYKQAYIESMQKRARILMKLEKVAAALSYYQVLIGMMPNDHYLHYNIGLCHQALDESELAKNAFEKSLSIAPNFVLAKSKLEQLLPDHIKRVNDICSQAKLFVDQRQFEAAQALLQQAVLLAPDYDRPYHYLFNLYWLLGDKLKAKRALLEAIKRNPNNQLYLHNLKNLDP